MECTRMKRTEIGCHTLSCLDMSEDLQDFGNGFPT